MFPRGTQTCLNKGLGSSRLWLFQVYTPLQLSQLPTSFPAGAWVPWSEPPRQWWLLVQGSQGRQPVSTAWVLAQSLVSPQRSKPAAFPDRYLIPVLGGSWETAERLLHCSHHHAAPSALWAPHLWAAFYGTVLSASSLFLLFCLPFFVGNQLSTPHSLLKILGTLEETTQ